MSSPHWKELVGESSANLARIVSLSGRDDIEFSFHDHDEIGPKMLARMAKHTAGEC